MRSPDRFFSAEQVEQSRRYHRPLYVAQAIDLVLGLLVLGLLAAFADWRIGPWWLAAPLLAAIAVAVSAFVRLPVVFWSGYVNEHRWGFSTQSVAAWAGDFFRKLLVACVFAAIPVLGVVGLAHALPSWWPVVAAPLAALFVLVVGFLAPVVLEPLFNRFEPLADEELAAELRVLAVRAGVPVRDVLVADASRRTTKVNAYVSGLGSTRRVVLFDTLLRRAARPELELVLAHELGHRRARHVVKGTVLGMLGAVAGTFVVWAVLDDPRDPTVAPLVLFVAMVLELLTLPFWTSLSRRFEREADRFSLDLTHDRDAFVTVHRELATANLSDLDPPRIVYRILFTHPTAPERIASAFA
ncbi:MAG: M48 family metallopeptidase [Actinobacteria bacterium]|nr:M48 family metallopeptidase [Actinomycetota bacterium]